MSDNALIDRSSREWSQGAVTDNVKMEINDREQACDESTSVDHDDSLNVENNLFEMYFARISPNKSLHLLEIPKDSVENDRNQVDAVEIKFVKDELHSQSAAESEDELCLDNVDHVKELGNLCDDKHGIQLMLDDSPLAALVDYQKPHVTAFMEDCQNDVKYCVESSVKLFNCMADVKLFQKSCVVLDNVDRARGPRSEEHSENLRKQHGITSVICRNTSCVVQRQSGSTLEHAGLTNRKEAWPKCILYGQLCSLEQHRQTCVLIDDDCPQPVHVKTDVQMSVKDERDGQKKIRWMKYIKISVKQNEVKYQCTLCDKALSSRGSIRNHVQTHLGDASFECGECGKMFGRIDHLRRHAKSHAKVKSFNCSQCDQSFTRSDRLKLHIRRCHDLNNVLYRCTYPNCNKAFSRSDVIRIHMRVHTGEKPYQCFRCGSSWAMQSNMTAHMRICGKQENPFKCRHCGAKFRSRRQVNKHQSVHYSEQPLTCNVCGRTFMTSHGLTSHAVTHVNSKQIICADCNKTFPSVQSLKDHISRHHLDRCDSKPVESVDCRRSNDLKRPRSKSRRPSCGDCCRCGQRIEDREKHACVDAEKKRFKCEYCTMRFAWPRSLRTHVERSHGESRIRRQDACKKKPEDGKDVATGRSVPDDDVGGLQITDGAETFSERNDGSINGAEDDVKPEIEVERSRCGENVADAKLSAAVSLVQSNCEGAKREFIIKREPSASPSAVTMDPAEKHEDLTSQNDAVTSLRCGLCHKIFSTRSILKRHMGVHSESRPFVCTSCGRCFRRSDTLSAHVTTHSRQ